LKPRERREKISAKWKFFILMICVILLTIMGVLWWFLLRV
jgi:hypothetical protein